MSTLKETMQLLGELLQQQVASGKRAAGERNHQLAVQHASRMAAARRKHVSPFQRMHGPRKLYREPKKHK